MPKRRIKREPKVALEVHISEWLSERGIPHQLDGIPSFSYQTTERNLRCLTCSSTDVVKDRVYTPDLYLPATGVYIEGKGKFPPSRRNQLRSFIEGRQDIDLRFVFQEDAWLTKKHASRLTDWARWCGVESYVWTRTMMKHGEPPMPEEWYAV